MRLLGKAQDRLAVGRLADDVEAFFLQHLFEVQTDDRLVFGDEHPGGLRRRPGRL